MVIALQIIGLYGITVAIVMMVCLFIWATEWFDNHDKEKASPYLRFVPKAFIWPHYAVRKLVLEMRETLREDD